MSGAFGVIVAMLFVLLSSLGTALPAMAKTHASSPVTWNILVGVDNKNFTITGMAYLTPEIWIDAGDTVTFIDRTPTDDPHTVSTGPPQGKKFPFVPYGDEDNFTGQPMNSGLLGSDTDWKAPLQGNEYSVTFNAAGTYQFYCAIHPSMLVTFTVS
jgi:plastocyanin